MTGSAYFKLAVFGLLILVILVAGCAQKQEQTTTTELEKEETSTQESAQEDQTPSEELTGGESFQCTVNTDCVDSDPCTTDSCTSGACENTPIAECQFKSFELPKITAANFGDLDAEFVQFEGKNYNIDGWTITNGKGEKLIQFNANQYRLINGKITIYSGCGSLSTTNVIYQCLEKDFFSGSGDKAVLYDENQTVVSEKAI